MDHIFHVVPSFFSLTEPHMILVPESLGRCYSSNCAVHYLLICFDIIFLVTTLRSCDNTESDCRCFFCSSNHRPDTYRVNSYRFFKKSMFIILHSLEKMIGTEPGWSSKNDHINIRKSHHLFISVKT